MLTLFYGGGGGYCISPKKKTEEELCEVNFAAFNSLIAALTQLHTKSGNDVNAHLQAAKSCSQLYKLFINGELIIGDIFFMDYPWIQSPQNYLGYMLEISADRHSRIARLIEEKSGQAI